MRTEVRSPAALFAAGAKRATSLGPLAVRGALLHAWSPLCGAARGARKPQANDVALHAVPARRTRRGCAGSTVPPNRRNCKSRTSSKRKDGASRERQTDFTDE